MKPARTARTARTALLAASALALVATLAACSSDSEDDSGLVESTFDIRLTTGTSMRGVSMTLRHAADFELLAIEDGDEPIASGTCSQNSTAGQIQATCATTTSFSSPIDAWRLRMRHPADRDLDEGILQLDCEGADVAGNTFAIGCQVVE